MWQMTSCSLDLFLCGGLCIAQELVNPYLYVAQHIFANSTLNTFTKTQQNIVLCCCYL